MIKAKKLQLTRETLVLLATGDLPLVQGGIGPTTKVSAAPVKCEPSGVRACP